MRKMFKQRPRREGGRTGSEPRARRDVRERDARRCPASVKLRGTILSAAGRLSCRARGQDGAVIKIKIAPQTRLAAIVPASLAGIKPGSFVGITSMPGDGSERIALEVPYFPAKPCAGPAKATAPGTKAPAAG